MSLVANFHTRVPINEHGTVGRVRAKYSSPAFMTSYIERKLATWTRETVEGPRVTGGN